MILWLQFNGLREFVTAFDEQAGKESPENSHSHSFVKFLLGKGLIAFSFESVSHDEDLIDQVRELDDE